MVTAGTAGQSSVRRQLPLLGALLVFVLLLGACTQQTDWEAMQPQSTVAAGDVDGSHVIAQSFVSTHNGLSDIELILVDYGADSGRSDAPLELSLCRDLQCQDPLAHQTITNTPESVHNQAHHLSFSPLPDSAGQTYYLVISAPQADQVDRLTFWAASDLYPDGSLFQDGQAVASDLTFFVYYTAIPSETAAALVDKAVAGLPHLPALLLLFLAPGYLLTRLLPRREDKDLLDRLGLSLALSAAAVPILLLLFSTLQLKLSGTAVLAGGWLFGALAFLSWSSEALFRRRREAGPGMSEQISGRSFASSLHFSRRGAGAVLAAVAGVTAVAIFLRAFHALDLTGPLWKDAVHHALLARLIVDQGRVPASYLPYAQVTPATYHFGFQSLVAVLHWLTRMPLQAALLLVGQTLNALAGLPLYVLGKRWGNSRWAGVAAAALPAAFSLMPSYYVSWSRYTELTGLFIMPVALFLLDQLLCQKRWHWGLAVVTTVAMAGLLVAHIRVAAFAVVLAGLLVLRSTARRRYAGLAMGAPWLRSLAVALGVVALSWTWLWPSVQHLWLRAAQEWPEVSDTLSPYFLLYGPGRWAFPIILVGSVLGLFWRRKESFLLFLWIALLVLLANPALLGLRMGSAVDNTSLSIALYAPVGLGAALLGGGAAALARRAPERLRRAGRWVGALLIVAATVWGSRGLLQVVNSKTALLTRSDLQAMEWIRQETPPDAVFLINSHEWMSSVYAGSDGGYWISPLTGRLTWPPTALYGLGDDPYIAHVNEVAQKAMTGEGLVDLLRANGIRYIYLGRYGGPLKPEALAALPELSVVYHQDGVWILELAP